MTNIYQPIESTMENRLKFACFLALVTPICSEKYSPLASTESIREDENISKGGETNTAAGDGRAAIIWLKLNSNSFMSIQIQNTWPSSLGPPTRETGQAGPTTLLVADEPCPNITRAGNRNFPMRVEINGKVCRVPVDGQEEDREIELAPSLGHYLCPDAVISLSSRIEVYISAWGAPYATAPLVSPLDVAPLHEVASTNCSDINVSYSRDVNISILIDNLARYAPFEGLNVTRNTRGLNVTMRVTNWNCPLPKIIIERCERTIVRVETLLNGATMTDHSPSMAH